MKWELPLLLSFVLLIGIFSTFPVIDNNFTVDENGLKHYVLTPEKNISAFDVVATSISKYNREIDFNEENPFLIFFLFVLLLVLLYSSNRVLQIQHPVLKTFASDYINLFFKNKLVQTLISTNKIILKEISEILFVLNTKLQINSNILSQNSSNLLINSKKFFVSKKIIIVLLFSVVLIVPVYDQAYAASGDITKSIVDTYEFDTAAGSYPSIIQVDSDTYAISYQGQGTGVLSGFVQTVNVDSLGNITPTGNTLEFETAAIAFTEIIAVDSDTFAIVYRSTGNDGFIQTVDITGAGVITSGANYEFDTTAGTDPQIVAVDSDTFAIAFQGSGSDGWLRTLNISSDGLTITEEDNYEFDTAEGRDNDIFAVDSDTFLVVHRGVDNDGFARTINISSNGTINSVEDTLEFEPTFDAYQNALVQIDSDTFAVVYRDVDSDGRLATLDIDATTGAITLVETLEYDTATASHPDIMRLDDKSFVITYAGAGNDGFIKTIPITDSGDIGTVTDTYEYDGGNGRFPSIISIDGNTIAIATRGGGNDGFLDTIFIDVEIVGTDILSVTETEDQTKFATITANSTPTVVSEAINSVNPVLNPSSTVNPSHSFSMAIYASSTPIPSHEVSISTIKTNDTFEFDTVDGETPDLVQVDSDTFAVAYQGTDLDGFIRTVNISSTGTITDTGNSLEFDTVAGLNPNIIAVDSDTFAVVYTSTDIDLDGFIKTVNITGAGVITDTGNSLEFDIADGANPDIIAVDSDTFAIVYNGTDADGFIKTVNITGAGVITDTGNSLEFDTGSGLTPDIVAVDSNTFVIAYTGNGNDGFVKTVDITSAGVISSVTDTLEFDTTSSFDQTILQIDSDTFAVTYRGPGSDGFVRTFDIDSSGNINSSTTDSLEFDTATGQTPDMVSLGSGSYGIAYRGVGNDGFFVIITIDNAGNIGNSVVESLEYNLTNGYNPSIIAVDLNTYAIAHRGAGADGFITTIDTSNQLAFSDSDVLDVVESTNFVKNYALSGTSIPIPTDSAQTTGNSIIDNANTTPTVVSSATIFKGFFLNPNTTPSVSDSGNTVAQYTRNGSDVLDVTAELNSEFKNYTLSPSSTPVPISNGTITFSIIVGSITTPVSTAIPSANISASSTPTPDDDATTIVMFILNANSTPVPVSTATPSANISASSTPTPDDDATTTVMFVLNANSTPVPVSTATPSANISASSTPTPDDDATVVAMFTLSANSTPVPVSTATPSANLSANSTPTPDDNGQLVGMFTISASSTPVPVSNATTTISAGSTPTPDDNGQLVGMFTISASSTPVPSDSAQVTGMFTITANSTPTVSDAGNTSTMFVITANSTPVPSDSAQVTGMFTITANSTPTVSDAGNLTAMFTISASSIPIPSSTASTIGMFTIIVSDILNVTENENSIERFAIHAVDTPIIAESTNDTKQNVLNITSIPQITELVVASGQYSISVVEKPDISESGNMSPRIESTNVVFTTQIDITFERNMDPLHVAPSNFVLTNPSATVKDVRVDGAVVSLILESPITSGQTPSIAISGQIKDSSGNTLNDVTVNSVDKVLPKVKKAYATTKSSIVVLFDKNVTSLISDYSNLEIPTGTSKTISSHTASDNVVTLIVDSADITARAHGSITISAGLTDTLGNSFDTNNNPVTVTSNIEEAPVELDKDFADLIITTTEIEIKSVIIEENTSATLDLSKSPTKTLVTEDGVQKNRVQITSELVITSSEGTDEEVQIIIPKDVLVSGPEAEFTGAIELPEPKVNDACTVDSSGGNIVSCVDVGLSNNDLVFNKAVKITLPGEGDKTPYYSSDGVTLQEISAVCDDAQTAEVSGTPISNDGVRECHFTNNSDMIIWTTHFTIFGTHVPAPTTTTTTTTSGSGSGGDSSSPIISSEFGPSLSNQGFGGVIGDAFQQSLIPGVELKPFPLVYNGIGYDEEDFDKVDTAIIETGRSLNVILSVYENAGSQNLQHVELYVNQFGSKIFNDLTETVIIYDKDTGVEIIDPHNLISSGSIIPVSVDTQSQFHFNIQFENEIEKSDVFIRLWDTHRNSSELHLPNALMVVAVDTKAESVPKDSTPNPGIISINDPEEITPEEITPEEITPEEITPEEITPEEITPEEITPEEITPEDVVKSEKIRVPMDPEPGTYLELPMDPEPGLDITQMDPEPGLDITQMDPEPGLDITQMDPEPGLDITQMDPEPTTKENKSFFDSITEFINVLSKLLSF